MMDVTNQLLQEINGLGYNGDSFVDGVKQSVQNRKKKGMSDRRNRYIHYCFWAHSLKRHKVGHDRTYKFPDLVLEFIRSICSNDIKGEIREDAYPVTLEEFCTAVLS